MNEQQGLDPMFQENGSQWMEGGLASEPLNVYTAKTFGWMFLGLLVTFGCKYSCRMRKPEREG